MKRNSLSPDAATGKTTAKEKDSAAFDQRVRENFNSMFKCFANEFIKSGKPHFLGKVRISGVECVFGFFVWSDDGETMYVNPIAQGFKENSLVGQLWYEFIQTTIIPMMAVIEPKSYYRADSAEEAHNEMIKNVAEDIDMATLAKISQVNEIIGNLERQKTMEEHFEELEKLVNAPATLEEGIQKMYEADKYLVENISLFEKSKERPSNMFFTLIDVCFMRRQYEIKVKEMIFAALARGEEVYIPVFRFDGQISNLGNVRKISDKSIVKKYLIDSEEVFDLDLVYGENEGGKNTFEVKSLFDNILNSIAEGRDCEDDDDEDW